MIRFVIPCVPVAQPRQRHRVLEVRGRTFAQNYTPRNHPVNAFKASVQMAVAQAFSGAPMSGPVALWVKFVMPRPQRLQWKTRQMPRQPHTSKPDVDNLAKALKDAMTGLVWRDDSQICHIEASKCIASGSESPHVEVCIEALSEVSTKEREEWKAWQANPS